MLEPLTIQLEKEYTSFACVRFVLGSQELFSLKKRFKMDHIPVENIFFNEDIKLNLHFNVSTWPFSITLDYHLRLSGIQESEIGGQSLEILIN